MLYLRNLGDTHTCVFVFWGSHIFYSEFIIFSCKLNEHKGGDITTGSRWFVYRDNGTRDK